MCKHVKTILFTTISLPIRILLLQKLLSQFILIKDMLHNCIDASQETTDKNAQHGHTKPTY